MERLCSALLSVQTEHANKRMRRETYNYLGHLHDSASAGALHSSTHAEPQHRLCATT